MRHNDYIKAGKCYCGADIYVPAIWTSKKYQRPKTGTCSHIAQEKLWEKEKEKNERRG